MGYKTPTCSIARRCGGCEWLSVPYPIQLKRKQAQVEELLAPLASINNVTIEPIRGMSLWRIATRQQHHLRRAKVARFAPVFMQVERTRSLLQRNA